MRYNYFISIIFLLNICLYSHATHWWTGAINHSWNNPGNWDPATVPGSGDDVFIVGGTPNECWVATANQNCHNLFIIAGSSLRIYDETLNVYGLMQIFGQLRMDHVDGFLITHGNIEWESGSTALITAYAGIRTNQNWEFASGSNVQMNDGYVQMFGIDDNQIISKSADSYFNNLVIANNGGVIDVSSTSTTPLTINGNLSITGGDTFTSHSIHDIILNGEFSYNNGHFIFYTGTFIFNGSPSDLYSNSGDYFHNLIINSTGNINLTSNLDVNGNLTMNTGTLVCNNKTIRVVGDWINNNRPYGFDRGTGTVIFYGNGNQNCYSDHFYNLTIDKTFSTNYIAFHPTPASSYQYCFVADQTHIEDGYILLMDDAILSLSSLTIDAASKLDASGATNATINITASWTDNNYPSPGFIEGTSLVKFTGPNYQYLTSPLLSSYDFYNVTVNKSNSYFSTALDLNIYGDITLESGGWTFYSTTPNHYYYGDIFLDGGGFFEDCNTIFTGSSDQNIEVLSSSSSDLGPITIDKTSSTDVVTVLGNLGVYTSGEVSIDDGTLRLDGSLFQCENNLTVLSGGILDMLTGSELQIGGGYDLQVNTGGTFQSRAAVMDNNLVTHYSSGYYSFIVQNTALVSAKHTTFEYMNLAGVNVQYGGLVDPAYPFDYCTFRNGQTSGTLLQLNCSQDLTITNAVFPANTWGSNYNVSRSNTLGTILFNWAQGPFAGESFDNDPSGVVEWEYEPTVLSVKIFLEGPFESSGMQTDLNTEIPLSHPYSGPPWNYSGTENVLSIPSPDIVDWVLFELRTSDSYASTATDATAIGRHTAFVENDGNVMEINGTQYIQFEAGIGASDNLFLVVYHRNHIPIMSANPLIYSGGVYNTDLSASPSAVYGSLNGCNYLASGIYGMIAGDGNADGLISLSDLLPWNNAAGNIGYYSGDMDLNTQVNNLDKNEFVVPNLGKTTQLP